MKNDHTFNRKLAVVGLSAAVIIAGIVSGCKSGCQGSPGSRNIISGPIDLPKEIKSVLNEQKWDKRIALFKGKPPTETSQLLGAATLKLNRDILQKSFLLGTDFLLKYQFPEGNFRYQYDWLAKTWKKGDNQVRQTGALWGLALCHRYQPSEKTKAGLLKGFEFWFERTISGPEDTLTVKYKNDKRTSTGTVALLALAIIEYLRVEKEIPAEFEQKLKTHLKGYLGFLKWMQLPNGQFASKYSVSGKSKNDDSSPYFDGETLLCLVKAARYLGYGELVPVIEKAARGTAETYTIRAWAEDEDSNRTKGFYQWGSMAFVEYYDAKWKDYELYGDVTLALGWWMIHTHETLERRLNTSYALEGLISAYRIAQKRADIKAATDLLYVIDRMLYKLTSWQINGPLADKNEFLTETPTQDEWAHGGVMNKAKPAKRPKRTTTYHELRVDVTQHQMHAVTLALRYVYPSP